ncbi:hypothetical protein B0T26DRAFT_672624 [Lasiosphaeria miniovina]|uniref:Uncharacterized protein n=1 Tax=Lasiosphaeria miniovina TaxID=1954250 RepID=A0AA40E4P3_9PEZI|nr:uncharacterized protein B0T26DRAFT_672624 [Lasiosphaeria miniovina]KAK0728029.1 hypothetical protein B0T26DRAFT_672624 [Lasiosphaeria miniovina]
MCAKHVSVAIHSCGKRVEKDYKFDACGDMSAPSHTVTENELASTKRGLDYHALMFGVEWQSSVLLDVFGMASIFYAILTGRWPYKPTPGRFQKVVYPNFKLEKFPDDVTDLPAGDVTLACWKREFATAKDALAALDRSLEGVEVRGDKCAEPRAVTEEEGGRDESMAT